MEEHELEVHSLRSPVVKDGKRYWYDVEWLYCYRSDKTFTPLDMMQKNLERMKKAIDSSVD